MVERTILPRPYRRQMEDHFNRLSDELQWARGYATDRAGWTERRSRVRQALVDALGGFPERTPLCAKVTGRLERDGYAIEKVVYESRPGFYVTGALYLPQASTPAPAILCPHGHWEGGRYHPAVQARMVGLARRGYVALSIDKVGYNDRLSQGHRCRAIFLVGQATQGIQVWDNLRGIDYLCSRPEVDPQRIGCTGCSGGGNQTMYISALDERIQAAAPVCSVELGECYMHKQFCSCELVPGLRRFADLVDICGLIAPRALLLVHGLLDLGFRIDSARKARLRLQAIYDALGASDKLDHFVSYDDHNYNQEMREAVYAWFDRHLKGLEPPYPREAPFAPEEPATLSQFPDGLPDGHVTLASLLADAASALPPRPPVPDAAAWAVEAARLRSALAERFSGWPDVTPLRPHAVAADSEAIDGIPTVVELLYFYSEPDVVVPAILYKPALERGRLPATIRFGDDGRRSVPSEAVAADLSAGRVVLLIDPRGTGETRAEGTQGDAQAYLSSVVLGRHFAAMRAWDVRRAADYLLGRPDIASVGIGVHGGLFAGLTGLLAAATDPRLAPVSIETLLASYKGQEDFGELAGDGQLAIVPGILKLADIEDLLALVAPRALTVGRFVTALGEPTVADPARCREVYRVLGASGALELPR